MPNRLKILKGFHPDRADWSNLNTSNLLAALELKLGLRWNWALLDQAVERGMPCHTHPLSRRKRNRAFDWPMVVAWLAKNRLLGSLAS